MDEIELVMKISKEEYEMIVNSEDCGLHTLTRAVARGTILPKGHSNLIDTKDLYEHLNKERDDNFALRVDAIVNRVKPIIEADKGD